jgi:formylglycine-generating enzyme required for sulfatase activity/serine/threonine protein kinase
MDTQAHLLRLLELRDSGLLSAQEFEAKARMLMARSGHDTPRASGPRVTTEITSGMFVGAYELQELVQSDVTTLMFRGRHRVEAIAARQGGDVAIKLIQPSHAWRGEVVARLRREAEVLASLDHPSIPKVFDLVEEGGRIGMVLEWVAGRSLSLVIGTETGPVPWERAVTWFQPMLDAVRHAHGRGVVHLALRPENVWVLSSGGVKVGGFGDSDSDLERDGRGGGPVAYRAPEQALESSVDERADVYALGMTLYEMLAGRLPWSSHDDLHVMRSRVAEAIPPPTEFYPSIPPWIVRSVMRCLAVDPAARFDNVAQLEAALMDSGDALPDQGAASPREARAQMEARFETEAPTERVEPSPSLADPIEERPSFREGTPHAVDCAPLPDLAKGPEVNQVPCAPPGPPRSVDPSLDRVPMETPPRFSDVGGARTTVLATPAGAGALVACLALMGAVWWGRAPVEPSADALSSRQEVPSAAAVWNSPSLGNMKLVPAGTFWMGSLPQEQGRDNDEPRHEVTLSRALYMMEHEVTQRQWGAVMGYNPSKFADCGPDCPVEQVSWLDVQTFIAKVNATDGVTYRLPTEAEWERAARGGSDFRYSGADDVGVVGWIKETSWQTTHKVCTKQRNGYGLCDMSGNVFEWVRDWRGDYTLSHVTDPSGPPAGSFRIVRGGSWGRDASMARVAGRARLEPTRRYFDLGFRLVLDERAVP